MRVPGGYGEDLAFIHDAAFGVVAEHAAGAVLELLRRAGHESGLVVDLGCGSGVFAAALLAAAYDVLGVDLSPEMIRLAERRAPRARFRVGSFLSARLPRCVAVTAIGEPISYLLDPRVTEERLAAFFARVHAALSPGGLFVLDFLDETPPRVRSSHLVADDWAVFADTVDDAPRRLRTRRVTTFRKAGAHYRRTDETHLVRLYETRFVESALESAGFRVVLSDRYGPLRLRRGHRVAVSTKGRTP